MTSRLRVFVSSAVRNCGVAPGPIDGQTLRGVESSDAAEGRPSAKHRPRGGISCSGWNSVAQDAKERNEARPSRPEEIVGLAP